MWGDLRGGEGPGPQCPINIPLQQNAKKIHNQRTVILPTYAWVSLKALCPGSRSQTAAACPPFSIRLARLGRNGRVTGGLLASPAAAYCRIRCLGPSGFGRRKMEAPLPKIPALTSGVAFLRCQIKVNQDNSEGLALSIAAATVHLFSGDMGISPSPEMAAEANPSREIQSF